MTWCFWAAAPPDCCYSIRPFLEEQAYVNLSAFAYAMDVVAGIKESTSSFAKGPPEIQRVRDQGFRRAIFNYIHYNKALPSNPR